MCVNVCACACVCGGGGGGAVYDAAVAPDGAVEGAGEDAAAKCYSFALGQSVTYLH